MICAYFNSFQVPSLALRLLHKLSHLSLAANNLTYLAPDVLYGHRLDYLSLYGNRIGECYGNVSATATMGIHAAAFFGATVTQINLGANRFRFFYSSILGDVRRSVRQLTLADNPLGALDEAVVADMDLVALDVSGTGLRQLPQP